MNFLISSNRHRTEVPSQKAFSMLHTHDTCEILCFLSGNANYSVEGNRYKLMPGDIMIMRKNEFHHLIIKSDAPYERIIVNFDLPNTPEFAELLAPFYNRAVGERNLYRPSTIKNNNMVFYLKKLIDAKGSYRKLCWLLPFLDELYDAFMSDNLCDKPTTDKATDVINFINSHITEEISLSTLANRFFISQNHLNRIFKESTGTTLWEYVTVKRLVLAREKLNNGEKPTEAALKSGFRDYATFFRAYKKHFNASPRAAKKGGLTIKYKKE